MFNFLKKLFSTGVDIPLLLKQGATIIDVRTPAEFKQGHVPGSVNIPLDRVSTKITELAKKRKAVITVCQSGGRSGMAKSILQKAGIEVYNGGSWRKVKSKMEAHV